MTTGDEHRVINAAAVPAAPVFLGEGGALVVLEEGDTFEIGVTLVVPEEHRPRVERCVEVYDLGCTIGQSLRAGIVYEPRTTTELID